MRVCCVFVSGRGSPPGDGKLAAFIARLGRSPTAEVRDLAKLRADMEALGERAGVPEGAAMRATQLGGLPALAFGTGGPGGPVVLYLHGGGYVAGSPGSHRHVCGWLARETAGTVFALDYRLAPEAACPAAIEDAAAAYRELAGQGQGRAIAMVGDSAGGGLAFAAAMALRDEGARLPACIVGLSPWVSHVFDDAAYDAPLADDPTLSHGSLAWYSRLYAPGFDPRSAAISPLHGELAGLPPCLIQVGGREVLRGDAAAMDAALKAAGVSSRLQVWPDLFHAWHLFWPWLEQGTAALAEVAAFIREKAGAA